jgi:hypothetical protein
MIFISLPAINEHLDATPSAGVHHLVCAILGYQQDVKHGISREVDVKWIKKVWHGLYCTYRAWSRDP